MRDVCNPSQIVAGLPQDIKPLYDLSDSLSDLESKIAKGSQNPREICKNCNPLRIEISGAGDMRIGGGFARLSAML